MIVENHQFATDADGGLKWSHRNITFILTSVIRRIMHPKCACTLHRDMDVHIDVRYSNYKQRSITRGYSMTQPKDVKT